METGHYDSRHYSVDPYAIKPFVGHERYPCIYGISGNHRPIHYGVNENACLYIGSTKDAKGRIVNAHIKDLEEAKHANAHLMRSWVKHNGVSGFSFFVLERVSDSDQLFNREQQWIDYYSDRHSFDALYNMSMIAGKVVLDEESMRQLALKRSEAWKGVGNPRFGTHPTGVNASSYGLKRSEEAKALMRESFKARVERGEFSRPEVAERTRIFFTGRLNHKNSRPIKQLGLDGKLIRIWASGAEAAYHTKAKKSNINICANKKRVQGYVSRTAGGFRWERATRQEFESYHGMSLKEYCQTETKKRQMDLDTLSQVSHDQGTP